MHIDPGNENFRVPLYWEAIPGFPDPASPTVAGFKPLAPQR